MRPDNWWFEFLTAHARLTWMCPTSTEVESLDGGRGIAGIEVGGSGQVQLVQRHGTVEDVLERRIDIDQNYKITRLYHESV